MNIRNAVKWIAMDLNSAVGQFFCRLTGINVSGVAASTVSDAEYFRRSANTVLFLNSVADATTLNGDLVRPTDLELGATSFSGRFEGYRNGDAFAANYLVLDAAALGCDTPRCVVEQTLNYLSQLYDWDVQFDQDLYGDGHYCE